MHLPHAADPFVLGATAAVVVARRSNLALSRSLRSTQKALERVLTPDALGWDGLRRDALEVLETHDQRWARAVGH